MPFSSVVSPRPGDACFIGYLCAKYHENQDLDMVESHVVLTWNVLFRCGSISPMKCSRQAMRWQSINVSINGRDWNSCTQRVWKQSKYLEAVRRLSSTSKQVPHSFIQSFIYSFIEFTCSVIVLKLIWNYIGWCRKTRSNYIFSNLAHDRSVVYIDTVLTPPLCLLPTYYLENLKSI